MAKVPKKVGSGDSLFTPRLPTNINPDGLVYYVVKDYKETPTAILLPAKSVLRECTDGWYQAFGPDKKKLHFRVNADFITKAGDNITMTYD